MKFSEREKEDTLISGHRSMHLFIWTFPSGQLGIGVDGSGGSTGRTRSYIMMKSGKVLERKRLERKAQERKPLCFNSAHLLAEKNFSYIYVFGCRGDLFTR